MTLQVHSVAVISTAHLTKEVAERLTADGNNNPWVPCAPWEYGFFVFLDEPNDHKEPVPQCLLDVRDWLLKLEREGKLDNSRWVRLDCDADTVDDLPTYDW